MSRGNPRLARRDEISTTEAENVDDSQSVFKVALRIPNTDQKAAQVASAPPGLLFDVTMKLMVIRQKVDRKREGGTDSSASGSVAGRPC